jgi:hypothetical protein
MHINVVKMFSTWQNSIIDLRTTDDNTYGYDSWLVNTLLSRVWSNQHGFAY